MHVSTGGEPAIRPLNPLGDVTVSKGFARREHATMVDALPFVTDLMGRAARPAYARFSKGRRLDPEGIDAIVCGFEGTLDALADTVGRYDRDMAATKARPRSRYSEKTRLCVSRDDNDFRLVSVSMGITSKRFFYEVVPTVLGWTRHAAERCYERVGGAGSAREVIGRTLAHHLPMAALAIEAIQARRGHCELAIPAGGGLLLGRVHEVPGPAWEGRYVHVTAHGIRGGQRPPASTLPDPMTMDATVACWKALTYIGPDEMKPEQEEYAARWHDLAAYPEPVDEIGMATQAVSKRIFAPGSAEHYRVQCDEVARSFSDLAHDPKYALMTRRTPYPPPPTATSAPNIVAAFLTEILGADLVAKGGWVFDGPRRRK